MARVTVEDCVLSVPNRFELCLIASKRARNILSGAHSDLIDTGEKPTVLALREIGENMIDVDTVREDIITSIKNRDSSTTNDEHRVDDSTADVIQSMNEEGAAVSNQAGPNFVSENIEVED